MGRGKNKIIKDKRGMENLEEKTDGRKTTRRGFLAWVAKAIGITAVISALGLGSGCKTIEEDYAKLPSGEIVYFQKPIMSVPDIDNEKHDVYEIDTKDGKRYIELWPARRLVRYDTETGVLTDYFKYGKDNERVGELKLPDKHKKVYKSIDDLKKELKKPKKGPIEFHPSIMLSR